MVGDLYVKNEYNAVKPVSIFEAENVSHTKQLDLVVVFYPKAYLPCEVECHGLPAFR